MQLDYFWLVRCDRSWNQCQVLENRQVQEIAEKFTRANCFKR
ncbi:MAG: hypothetical protein V7K40_25740 [Nostoc sp.]